MDAESAATIGLLNAFRTGNVVLDTMISSVLCMCLPLLLGNIKYLGSQGLAGVVFVFRWFTSSKNEDEYTRVIEYVEKTTSWGSVYNTVDEKNNILQKAITMELSRLVIAYQSCDLKLTAIKEPGSYDGGSADASDTESHGSNDSDDDDDNGRQQSASDIYGNTSDQLRAYKITKMPPMDEWVSIGKGILFKQSTGDPDKENMTDDEKKASAGNSDRFTSKRIRFEIMCSEAGGEQRVESWVQQAYDNYCSEISKASAKSAKHRFLYMPKVNAAVKQDDASGNTPEPAQAFKRYKLSDHKTFNSLFFQGKPQLLKVLDDFQQKKGKFGVAGFPHKLGLLLYGPPGTGKTSLIKALAQYTGRNIVSIPLTRIKTNQQLMDVFMDQRFGIDGEDIDIRLGFKNTIFVMEDIDAMGKIVHKRATNGSGGGSGSGRGGASAGRAATVASNGGIIARPNRVASREHKSGGGGGGGGGSDSGVTTNAYDSDDDMSDEDGYSIPIGPLPPTPADGGGGGGGGGGGSGGSGSGSSLKGGSWGSSLFKTPDKLDLSGILNVLDGVVDTPGRLLVMTTNHPEKLDPALIRPGRIDKNVKLGFMEVEDALAMVAHYFGCSGDSGGDDGKEESETVGGIPEHIKSAMVEAMAEGPGTTTPAQVEQLCAEYDTLEGFCNRFVKEARSGFAGTAVQSW